MMLSASSSDRPACFAPLSLADHLPRVLHGREEAVHHHRTVQIKDARPRPLYRLVKYGGRLARLGFACPGVMVAGGEVDQSRIQPLAGAGVEAEGPAGQVGIPISPRGFRGTETMRAAAAALLVFLAALAAVPGAVRADAFTDCQRLGKRAAEEALARGDNSTAAWDRATRHCRGDRQRAFVPCEQWGQMTALAAHERNLGYSLESRLRGLGVPGSDPAVIETAKRMARDLWARPHLTPPEARMIAYRACDWPR